MKLNAFTEIEDPSLSITRLVALGEITLKLAVTIYVRQMVGDIVGINQRKVVLGCP